MVKRLCFLLYLYIFKKYGKVIKPLKHADIKKKPLGCNHLYTHIVWFYPEGEGGCSLPHSQGHTAKQDAAAGLYHLSMASACLPSATPSQTVAASVLVALFWMLCYQLHGDVIPALAEDDQSAAKAGDKLLLNFRHRNVRLFFSVARAPSSSI